MTEEIFRTDSYAQTCQAVVTAVAPDGIRLDRTVFYPMGGGQPGDTGLLRRTDGTEIAVSDTRKDEDGDILHVVAAGHGLEPGAGVTAAIDWPRRHRLMRMHSCLHLLCSVVPGGVTGGSVGDGKGRLDFDLQAEQVPDKDDLTAALNRLVEADSPVTVDWISDDALAEQPELVRTMSVKPPSGSGRVRLVNIAGVDLQPCGGTHVARTGEIGRVVVTRIENKGKRNRRVNISLED